MRFEKKRGFMVWEHVTIIVFHPMPRQYIGGQSQAHSMNLNVRGFPKPFPGRLFKSDLKR